MLDPFSAWTRLMATSFDLARTGVRTGETIAATLEVLAARGAVIETALRSPAEADLAELAMMLPEKLAALSLSGAAVMNQLAAMQTAMVAEANHLGTMAMRGRPPTLGELASLQMRGADYALRTLAQGAALAADALDPIHARVTGNARRLRARRKG